MAVRLAKILGASAVTLLVAILVFRFAIYRHLYIAPGDPYGFSDVIEFYLGCALVFVLAASALSAMALIVVGPRERRVAGGWLMGACAVITLLVLPLHNLAARYAP